MTRGKSGIRVARLAATVMLAALLLAPVAGQASSIDAAGTLPSTLAGASAATDGTYVYLFGGDVSPTARSSKILRYDSATQTIAEMAATLPTPRTNTSAVWDDDCACAYVIGGFDGYRNNEIVRYDPATDSATVMSAKLPTISGTNAPSTGRTLTSAVYDGSNVYIFGGADVTFSATSGTTSTTATSQILKFDPVADTLVTLPGTLPSARYATSAAWSPIDRKAYIFGGNTSSTARSAAVIRFDPTTGTAVSLASPVVLPTARAETSAVWNPIAERIFVYGGFDGSNYLTSVVALDPLANSGAGAISLKSEALGTGRSRAPSAAAGNAAFVFGGIGLRGERVDGVVRHVSASGVLPTLIAYTGQTSGTWGSTLPASAAITDQNGAAIVGRSLTVALGSVKYTALTDATGSVATTFTLPSTPGTSVLTITYGGDETFAPNTVSVTITTLRHPTTLAYTGPVDGNERASAVRAKLTDSVSNAPISGRSVQLALHQSAATVVTDASGSASATLTAPRGDRSASAAFSGDTLYQPASTDPVPYAVDWGYAFTDDEGNGVVKLSILTGEFEYTDAQGEDSGIKEQSVAYATFPQRVVAPAPTEGIALVTYSGSDITLAGSFDLGSGNFFASLMRQGSSLAVLRHVGCDASNAAGCVPSAPACVYNQDAVKPYVVVHGSPACA